MLSQLTIRNFAIIDDLNLSLSAGMTVFSGETGAGKSILIDALGLLLGDRADAGAVRDGTQRADITAAFLLDDAPAAQAWLAERELDGDGDCILRRVINSNGRSRNWINGSLANARDLRALGEHLVDIHGQHAHQQLLRAPMQRQLLDEFGTPAELRQQLMDLHTQLRELKTRIAELEQTDAQGTLRVDLLRYQVQEMQALDLQPGEIDAIATEHKRLANAQRLIDDGHGVLAMLFESEDSAAVDILANAERVLNELATLDDSFASVSEAIAGARLQAQETAGDLRHVLDRLNLDPARLAELDNRLTAIQDLARKHHCRPEQLIDRAQSLADELGTLENAGETLQQLHAEYDQTLQAYRKCALSLSRKRQKAAKKLGDGVTSTISDLGMHEGQFEITVEHAAHAEPTAHGLDTITYLVAANPGQQARPLERVASGGELSRISLAIQVVAANSTHIPTLVFDEVDAGIGGGVAEIVGRLLRQLGSDSQTLCVTHLPQVAAQALQHLQVSKHIHAGTTRTRIQSLTDSARVEELARMLGGTELTERSLDHAREMLEQGAA